MAGTPKPLQTISILMTRPTGSNGAFLDRIASDARRRLHEITSPLIAIRPLDQTDSIGPETVAIFTSGNGVEHTPLGVGQRAYCVGEQTTARAAKRGWAAVCAGPDAATLVEALIQNAPSTPLVHFHGVHLRVDVARELNRAGLTVTSRAVYDQVLQPLSREAQTILAAHGPVLVPLFSPRTAKHFCSIAPVSDTTTLIAMSAAVAAECTAPGVRSIVVAPEPTAQAMAICVEKKLEELCPG